MINTEEKNKKNLHAKEIDLDQSLTEDSHFPNVVMPESAYSNLNNHHHHHYHQFKKHDQHHHKEPQSHQKFYHHEPPHHTHINHAVPHHSLPATHHEPAPVYHNFHHDPSPHNIRGSYHRKTHSDHHVKQENETFMSQLPTFHESNHHDEINTTRSRASRSLNRSGNLNNFIQYN